MPFGLSQDDLIVIVGLVVFVVVFLGGSALLLFVVLPRIKRHISAIWHRPNVQKACVCSFFGHHRIVTGNNQTWSEVTCKRCHDVQIVPIGDLRFRAYIKPEDETVW